MKLRILTVIVALMIMAGPALAGPGETETTLADQTRLYVTIYNQDLALIKDGRTLELPPGEQRMALNSIS